MMLQRLRRVPADRKPTVPMRLGIHISSFEKKTIFNEDMIFAGKIILNGGGIAYVPEARVIHSHNYGNMEQLRRNFDLAVSQAEHPEIFALASSESEGMKLVKQTAQYLVKSGHPWLLPELVVKAVLNLSVTDRESISEAA